MGEKLNSNTENPLTDIRLNSGNALCPQRNKDMVKEATPKSKVLSNNDDAGKTNKSHPLFIQMSTLNEHPNEQFEWRQSARWVKFEEDVEEGGQRWSKPYVASLSMHYLFALRSILSNGIVMLDMDASNMNQMSEAVVENMINTGDLPTDVKEKMKKVLMSQQRHLFELTKHRRRQKCLSTSADPGASNNGNNPPLERKDNKRFMKKLPPDAESASILTGETKFLRKSVSAFIRMSERSQLGNMTEVNVPTRFCFILLGPKNELPRYREIGRAIGTMMSDEVFREASYQARDKKDLIVGIDAFIDSVTVLPPAAWDPNIRIEPPLNIPSPERRKSPIKEEILDEEEEERRMREETGLVRTHRLFGGLINDVKRKAPWYFSDFKDALSLQSISTICFLYFACLTPIITFGGLLGVATGNNIAALESLVSGLVCGVIYGLFAGQPLTILGSTGPVLVFEAIVYNFCRNMEWNYLELRLWIGLWIAGILVILVAFDASSFVCYITRFTEENFATLIALIFIVKAIENVWEIGQYYPMATLSDIPKLCECNYTENILNNELFSFNGAVSNSTTSIGDLDFSSVNGTTGGYGCHKYYPDVFLLSIVLFCGTYVISTSLKNFKTSSYFPTWVRNFLSDFAVIIGIISMTLLDYSVGIETPKLLVPENFKPTNPDRGWVVQPFAHNPWWTPIAAVAPALLACILLFMDQQITSVIINRKENKLKKGCGYHLDLFVLAFLIAINSILGLPWFVAATVLAINHVSSLKLESETSAPGEKPQFLGVRENRVTQIIIFLLIGGSVFMTPLLKKIPMPVLFGVFLYMGVAALQGSQFFDRVLIMFMPAKYQPDYAYLRDVPIRRVHLFTCVQLACLAGLWILKSFSQISILFPIMLLVMIGVRKLLDKFFTQRELKILDDILPEFRRKQKLKDQDERRKRPEMKKKHEEMTIISLTNGNSRKVIKIPSHSDKNEVWRRINQEESFAPFTNIPEDGSKRKDGILLGINNVSYIDSEELECDEGRLETHENKSLHVYNVNEMRMENQLKPQSELAYSIQL